jgi:hypothetical protein
VHAVIRHLCERPRFISLVFVLLLTGRNGGIDV